MLSLINAADEHFGNPVAIDPHYVIAIARKAENRTLIALTDGAEVLVVDSYGDVLKQVAKAKAD